MKVIEKKGAFPEGLWSLGSNGEEGFALVQSSKVYGAGVNYCL
jgi:hypothetical protein